MTTTLNLAAASPAELRAECDRLGLSYRTKDDRKTLTRKIVNAQSAAPTGPSQHDVDAAVAALQSELESPEFAAALNAPIPPAAERMTRMKLAKDEAKTMKAWRKSGAKGTPPETPNLDALNAESTTSPRKATGAKATTTKRTSASTTSGTRGANAAPAAGLRFYRDGKAYNDRDNARLSNVAARAKVSSADLRVALGDRKLDAPFAVTLSNGVNLELRAE